MKWLDNIPYVVIVPLAVLLGLAPFTPEPHLWEKLRMLFAGTLVRPIDIFDLLLHGTPLLVLLSLNTPSYKMPPEWKCWLRISGGRLSTGWISSTFRQGNRSSPGTD